MVLSESNSSPSYGRIRSDKYSLGASSSGELTFHAIHFIGRFLRLLSVYIVYEYLLKPDISVVIFMFVSTLVAALVFLALQRPWKGRPLSTSQLVPTVINGGVLALSFVLWGQGLRACGPVRTVLAEYAGAVLGAVSTLLFGRGGQRWKKVGGLMAMLASFYFLAQGWAMATYSPFSFRDRSELEGSVLEEGDVGIKLMTIPILAGILAALRRVVARRVSLKAQLKRRFHAVTVATAACFLFPFAILELTMVKGGANLEIHGLSASTYFTNSLFGVVLIFYIDSFAEERLRLLVASPKHLMVAGGCLIILELLYKMDFSLLGFLICSSVLGLGIFEATSSEKFRKDSAQLPAQRNEIAQSQDSLIMSPLPS